MGFFVPEPTKRGRPLPTMVGPVVRLGVCDAATWRAVVLVVCKHTDVEFVWHSPSTQEAIAPSEVMMSADGWRFLRFKLAVPVTDGAQQVLYRVKDRRSLGEVKNGCITVAGRADEWNLVAYSCYDQRRAIGEALWRDVAGAPMLLSPPAGPRLLLVAPSHAGLRPLWHASHARQRLTPAPPQATQPGDRTQVS